MSMTSQKLDEMILEAELFVQKLLAEFQAGFNARPSTEGRLLPPITENDLLGIPPEEPLPFEAEQGG